ncbi:MAG TPA: DUF3568 family protein [Gemmataceae bacterium]|nr:DUF3568 family protein [Gemmataceae bacterium]
MPEAVRKQTGRMLYPIVATLAILQGGCLLALAGVGAGAAATGYLYAKGRIYRDYPASLPDVRNAVRAALLDLHFLIFTEEAKDGKAFLVTKTTNGKKVRVYLDCLASPIPAEGLVTRVSIRVGAFGDENVSMHILDQVAWRLSHGPAPGPVPVPAVQPGPPTPIQQTSGVQSFQTTEPPPARPQPAKAK